ncbi:MAG TPA: hypothetical protein VF178_15255 [Gemmatimonadaceae bacterium]
MRVSGSVLSACLAVFSIGALANPARAQAEPDRVLLPGRFAVEEYMTRYRLGIQGDRVGMNGIGGRVLWNATLGSADAMLARPAALGLYVEYAGGRDEVATVLHGGLQGDVSLVSTPWFGRLEPVASLGLGVMRMREHPAAQLPNPPAAGVSIMQSPVQRARTDYYATVTPGLGMRVGLFRQLGVRADVRDVITAGSGVDEHLSFTGGLSLTF